MGKNTDISRLIALQLAANGMVSPAVLPEDPTPLRWQTRVLAQKKWLILASLVLLVSVGGTTVWLNSRPLTSHLISVAAAARQDDDRVETLPARDKPAAIRAARKSLGAAIALLGHEHPDQTQTLRRRLIGRLLQQPEPRFIEVERQIVLLDASPGDPQSTKWLAKALVGQVNQATYRERDANEHSKVHAYWNWLAHQPPGDVLLLALKEEPANVRLVASLVVLASDRPELFSQPTQRGTADDVQVRQLVRQCVAALSPDDRSQSLLVQHQFHRTRNSDQATKVLLRGANAAEKRLLLRSDQAVDHGFGDQQQASLGSERPASYWDFVLLSKAAAALHPSNPTLAARYYRSLHEIQLECVPASLVEQVYVRSGHLALQQGKSAEALRVWRTGLERVNGNSLQLLGAITSIISRDENPRRSHGREAVLQQYLHAIATNAEALADTSTDAISTASRRRLGRQINVARWRANVLEAQLLFESDAKGDAMEQLRLALTSSVDVDVAEQQRACVQLANWYLAEGAADCAATFFEQAISLTPHEHRLREQAARAWMIAGNRTRAAEHWDIASGGDDLLLKVNALESMFQRAIVCDDREAELERVRAQAVTLRDYFSLHRSDKSIRADLRRASSRLEIVQACLPPKGVSLDSHVSSRWFLAEIAGVAREYRDDEMVQRFAAEYLAATGDVAESERAFAALEELLGAVSTDVAITKARMLAATQTSLQASNHAIRHVGSTAEDTRRALLHAFHWAVRGSDPELAFQALAAIPAASRTCHDLFMLAKLSLELPSESEIFARRNTTADKLTARLRVQLRQREGGACGFDQYLQAREFIRELSSRNQIASIDDPQLVRARHALEKLATRRPNWSEATLLAADLAVIEGNQRQATRLLRDAWLAGDDHPALRQRLRDLQPSNRARQNHWAHLASFHRTVTGTSPHARETVSVRQLLVAHQSMTGPVAFVPSRIF